VERKVARCKRGRRRKEGRKREVYLQSGSRRRQAEASGLGVAGVELCLGICF
jgi:hypothetical protein